ncbi:MAG: peptidoglycan-associated lipoprotein Pal [Limisphaerales bacterium]
MFNRRLVAGGVLAAALVMAGCGGKKAPVTPEPQPAPPVTAAPTNPARPAPPPQQAREPLPVPPQPVPEDGVSARSLDDLNRNSPLTPVFFGYDSAELSEDAQKAAQANAAVLRTNRTWVITIEGHCDERGTAEYNLALGERRASSVKAYLVSMGIVAERLRVVSYGKEFPFDAGHDEAAWSKNRRGHFVVTAK